VKRRWLLALIGLNVTGLIALAFAYPHLMVSPGALVPAHAGLTTDCFACHAPLRGASSDRCIACHALQDIGLRTSKGVPIARATVKTSFHQDLTEQNCMACHSEHAGPKLTQRSRKPFSHDLLKVNVRDRCNTCHAAPANDLHRDLTVECGKCHKPAGWKPATFDHTLLPPAELNRCETCHKTAPADNLHQQVRGHCVQCHQPKGWKPSTFDHGKFFVLDGDHNAPCATCHADGNFSRYSCYGCHEHTPTGISRKHREEGIQNFENCVECHRSAEGEPEHEGRRQGNEARDGRKRD
jgi:hypothetical protein